LVWTLAAIAREQPLLLLLDDLHWVDEATAAFFVHLGRELIGSRVLVLGAYRSATVRLGRRDPQSGESVRHPMTVAVNELRRVNGEIVLELDRADGRAFVEALVNSEPNRLGARFRDALYAHTGGHALFTVESLRNLQARGELFKDEAGRWMAHESLDWGRLPARVEAAIAERIERLPEACRRFLSAASVQGDDFTAELVAEMVGTPLNEVLAALSGSLARQHQLVRAEGLGRPERLGQAEHLGQPEGCQRGAQRSVYRFSHHLFQKYLYDQLDPVERGRWHAAVASSLEHQVGDDPAERKRLGARLAWHYESAGLPLQAAGALLDAGRQAVRLSAFRDALNLFDHGLALLGQPMPAEEAAKRTELERMLQIARFVPERSLSGSGATHLEGVLARVLSTRAIGGEACDEQDRTKLVTLEAEADHFIARGQFEEVLGVAQRMLDLATECGDEDFVAMSHFWFGFIYHMMARPQEAENCFQWVFSRHVPGRWAELRALVGFDIMPHALTIAGINSAILGYPEAALRRSAEAMTSALELGDMYGLAFASAIGSMTLFLLRNNSPALQERSELSCRHCEQHGFSWWQRYAEVFLGWMKLNHGDLGEGIERMQNAIAAWKATGMVVGTDSLGVVLAGGYLEAARLLEEEPPSPANAGRPKLLADALTQIDAQLAPNTSCGQIYEAELHRMRGELLLACHGLVEAGEAVACFRRAMDLGREQGALTWELRGAMSLVRLRLRQGESYAAELAEACGRLRALYRRFTEGFAFPDLQDAAELIRVAAPLDPYLA
jgi:tetratricopeptide (TPR) repeat protein